MYTHLRLQFSEGTSLGIHIICGASYVFFLICSISHDRCAYLCVFFVCKFYNFHIFKILSKKMSIYVSFFTMLPKIAFLARSVRKRQYHLLLSKMICNPMLIADGEERTSRGKSAQLQISQFICRMEDSISSETCVNCNNL